MRVFLAVALPAAVAGALDAAADALPRAGWRPVGRAQRHVTLRFLGEQPEQGAAAALEAARRAAARDGPFALEVAGLGAFPSAARPQVVWAGCRDGAQALAALAGRLERELAAAGFPAEQRPLRAHVTLGRRRPGRAPALAAAEVAALLRDHGGRAWGTVPVDAVTLFRSELRPDGARHTPLGRAALAPAPAPDIP